MKKRWTRGELALFGVPLLLLLFFGIIRFGPDLGRRVLGAPRVLVTTPDNHLRFLRLSNDGRVLAATGQVFPAIDRTSGTIHLWNADTLEPLPPVPPLLEKGGQRAFMAYGLAFTPTNRAIGFSHEHDRFDVLDVKTHRVVWSTGIWAEQADFPPDGKRLAIGESDEFFVVETKTHRILQRWKNIRNYERLVLWSPNGQTLASPSDITGRDDRGHAGHGGKIELRNPDGKKLHEIGSDFTNSFNFSPDSQTIVATVGKYKRDFDGSEPDAAAVRCFDVASGTLKWEQNSPDGLFEHYQDATFSRDGKLVAVHAKYAHAILLLDAVSGKEVRRFSIQVAQDTTMWMPHSLVFSRDGKRLFVRGKDAVMAWDLE